MRKWWNNNDDVEEFEYREYTDEEKEKIEDEKKRERYSNLERENETKAIDATLTDLETQKARLSAKVGVISFNELGKERQDKLKRSNLKKEYLTTLGYKRLRSTQHYTGYEEKKEKTYYGTGGYSGKIDHYGNVSISEIESSYETKVWKEKLKGITRNEYVRFTIKSEEILERSRKEEKVLADNWQHFGCLLKGMKTTLISRFAVFTYNALTFLLSLIYLFTLFIMPSVIEQTNGNADSNGYSVTELCPELYLFRNIPNYYDFSFKYSLYIWIILGIGLLLAVLTAIMIPCYFRKYSLTKSPSEVIPLIMLTAAGVSYLTLALILPACLYLSGNFPIQISFIAPILSVALVVLMAISYPLRIVLLGLSLYTCVRSLIFTVISNRVYKNICEEVSERANFENSETYEICSEYLEDIKQTESDPNV